MKTHATRIARGLFNAGLACAAAAAAMNPAAAQELGSAGDRVEVTWAGKPTAGRIDHCTATACYLYLYDDVSGRWSDGTAFFPQKEIRGLKGTVYAAVPAPAAEPAASGASTERIALGLQASGRFDQAGAMFQRAADAYRGEGNAAANVRALKESAAAYEAEADRLLGATPNNARTPMQAAASPVRVQAQAIAATPVPVAAPPAPLQGSTLAAAGAGAIPAGRYACDFAGGGSPGYVDIRGNTYRGPTLDGSGSFRPYVIGGGNSITWTAGFGEFTVVKSQFMGNDTRGHPWFAVTYSRTRGGGVDQVDCLRE